MTTLVSRYSGLVVDLDGVVYRGADAIPHAVDALNAAGRAGAGVVYATNNASRTPDEVYSHLRELGIELTVDDVMTSAMAGAARVAQLVPAGSSVLVVGGDGVTAAVESVGLRPIRPAQAAAGDTGDAPLAVLQGYGRDVGWVDLAEAAFTIQGGAAWVATNVDLTIPVARGIVPGNGTLVAAVRRAVDVDPEVVGKPYPALYLRCAERIGRPPEETLAIGDRLDTDIEGANRTGMDSLFVLTGVDGPRDIVEAEPERRPTYLGADLRALHEPYVEADLTDTPDAVEAVCEGARVRISTDGFELGGGGSASARLRAVVAAGVHHGDQGRSWPTWPDVMAWIHEGTP